MIEAELYDGTVLEFPEGTNPEVIQATVKQVTARNKRMAALPKSLANAAEPVESPVAGNSFLQNAAIGIGKAYTDIGLGAQQMLGLAPPSAADEKRQMDAAIMGTTGGNVGYMLGGATAALPAAMAAGATVPGAMFAGGLYGAFQPADSGSQRYLNTGTSALLAGGGQYGLDRLGRWLGSYPSTLAPGGRVAVPENFAAPTSQVRARSAAQADTSVSVNPQASLDARLGYTFGQVGDDPSAGLTQSQRQIADRGLEMGMRLTPGQATGSKALQQLEAKMESQPMTSGPFWAIKDANQKVLDRAWAGAIGQNADTVDSSVLAAADDRLGAIFQSARDPNSILAVDPKATASYLDGVDEAVRGLLPNNGSVRDNALIADLERLTGEGGVNAEQLGQLSSKLGKAAYKAMTSAGGDRDWGSALYLAKEHVDDLISQTLSGTERATYDAARKQYRNLMLLTQRTGTVNPSTGHVRGNALATLLQQKDRGGFLYGRNQSDAYAATRFAQAFQPIVGDSGTATRSPLPSGSLEWALSVPTNLAARAYTSSGSVAAARAVAGAAGKVSPAVDAMGRGFNSGVAAGAPYYPFGLPGIFANFGQYLRDNQ